MINKEEALTIYNEIPDDSSIFPSNLFGENKYNDRITKFCQFIGFTADIYNKSSRIDKTGKCLTIIMIAYKGISPYDADKEKRKYYHKGHFKNLIKKITEELDLPVVIYCPLERMQEIGEKQGWLEVSEIKCLLVFPKTIKEKLFKNENTIGQQNKLVDSIFH